MIVVIGEILFDEFPEYRRVGGAPFNVAYHLRKLGFDIHFVTRVGTDEAGQELVDVIRNSGMDMQCVEEDTEHTTGRVDVRLDKAGIPEYNIVENTAYDYIDFSLLYNTFSIEPALVYYGSLIQRTSSSRQNLQEYLSSLTEKTLKLYDMNLRQGCVKPEIVIPSLQQCDVLKINDEELETTARLISVKEHGPALVKFLMARYRIKFVALTHGPDGSSLFSDTDSLYVPADDLPNENIVDTVGAGDAFTAVLAQGLLNENPPGQILSKASWFSQKICAVAGAIPHDKNIYRECVMR